MNHRINEAAMGEREQFERTMHDQLIEYVEALDHQMWRAEKAEAVLVRMERKALGSAEAVAAEQDYLIRLESVQRAARAVLVSIRSLDGWGLIRGKP